MKRLSLFLLLLSLIGTSAVMVGCGEDPNEVSVDDSLPSDPDPDPPSDPSTPSEVSFNLAVSTVGWSGFLHEDGSTTEGCSITKSASPREYIACTLEVPERSNQFRDIPLQINIPTQMCRYLSFDNYYYYNWQVGSGPTAVSIRNYDDGSTPTCGENGGAATSACSTMVEYELGASSTTPACVYDHSRTESSYPNCCYGNYTFTTEQFDMPGGSATSASTVSQQSWGDAPDQMCYGGTASRDSSWPKSFDNVPRPLIVNTWVGGYAETYNLLSPISLTRNERNLFTANHYAGAMPQQIAGYNDLSGDAMPATNSLYSFDCLDEGGEVVHSIDLRIREWDTLAEYDTFVSTGVGTSDNLITDVEGTDCAYEDPSGGLCNDVFDWDDLGGSFPESLW